MLGGAAKSTAGMSQSEYSAKKNGICCSEYSPTLLLPMDPTYFVYVWLMYPQFKNIASLSIGTWERIWWIWFPATWEKHLSMISVADLITARLRCCLFAGKSHLQEREALWLHAFLGVCAMDGTDLRWGVPVFCFSVCFCDPARQID